jgi:hypothetical protein
MRDKNRRVLGEFDATIARENAALKAARIRVRIERSHSRLVLRAKLPPRPDSLRTSAHQQRISTGFSATPSGLRAAVSKAKQLAAAVEGGRFDWGDYGYTPSPEPQEPPKTFGQVIEAFEQDYFERRSRDRQSDSTWCTEYESMFCRLPANEVIDVAIAIKVITAIAPDTRQRKRAAIVFDRLFQFAGISAELKKYQGRYSPRSVEPRHLPSDEEIVRWREQIHNPEWRLAYSRIAAYGVRPSEVMALQFVPGSAIARVTEGKTGDRLCLPIRPEWFELWQLGTGDLPRISGRHNRDLGDRINKAFKRYGVPFQPYDLRHCYARRAFELKVGTDVTAESMGHDLRTHQRIYRRWIKADTFERIYQEMIDDA